MPEIIYKLRSQICKQSKNKSQLLVQPFGKPKQARLRASQPQFKASSSTH
ncbi:hypothetical protein WKK05_05505 [Nostoc sp. UHCC 0302]